MGTAFSSSLFGLGGSLVLGFVDLQAGHAQNRFFNELEEWLSGVTQLIDKGERQASVAKILPVPQGFDEVKTQLVMMNRELRENHRMIERMVTGRSDGKRAGRTGSAAAGA